MVARSHQGVVSIMGIVAVCALAGAPIRAAQDALARAKDFYASANYEDALKALDGIETAGPPAAAAAEVDEYRIFCLIALGRTDDAQHVIASVVRADPLYHLSDAASPRIRTVFDGVRRSLLPDVVRESYASAREAFDRKDMTAAAAGFDRVLALLDDAAVSDMAGIADMRTLASGFRDLSRAALAAAAPAVRPAPAPASSAASMTSGADGAAAAPGTPASAPSSSTAPAGAGTTAAAAAPRVIFSAADADVTPPVPVSRSLPPWRPPSSFEQRQEFQGQLELLIDERGAVTSAIMRKGVTPAYDASLIAAARDWKFRPARRAGAPVKFLYSMEIHLKPS
jgi:hypothetical protein